MWKELLRNELGCIAGDVTDKNTGDPAWFLFCAYSKYKRGRHLRKNWLK